MAYDPNQSQWHRGYNNVQQHGESYPMLPPQGARLPRYASDGGRRLPSSTLPPPASSAYAERWVYNHNPPGPTYSPGYIPVSGCEDDPPSEYRQHRPPQSDSNLSTSQWQKRKAVRGDSTQQTYLPLRPTPEGYDLAPPPIHSETRPREEFRYHDDSYAGHADGLFQRTPAISMSNVSGAEDGLDPTPNYSTTSLGAATEGHATDSRNRPLQNLFHKPHPRRQTQAYRTEINDVPKPQDRNNPYLLEADNWLNRAVHKLGLKQKLQWTDSDFFHDSAWFSWSIPHSYQIPGRYYSTTIERALNGDKSELKHLDVFRREHEGREDDRYLDPIDGRVRKLVVQSTRTTYNQRNNTTWRRTYVGNVSPYIIRLAYWPVSSVPSSQESSAVTDKRKSHEVIALASWKKEQWMHVGLRWLPTCIGLLIMMIFPTDVEGQTRNNGYYDPFPYRFWSYSKSATNPHEQAPVPPALKTNRTQQNLLISTKRTLRPDFLCFLDAKDSHPPYGRIDPEVWRTTRGNGKEPVYVFISFIGSQFRRDSRKDTEALHNIARVAAFQAQVPSYWIECCMPEAQDKFRASVYGISDVVRGASSVAIVVGQTGKDTLDPEVTTNQLLGEWGTRMWTLPEVLLAPIKQNILVYTRGSDLSKPLKLSKSAFPYRAWEDGDSTRNLIDHYENTLTLSRLELPIIALRCLRHRAATAKEPPFLPGDLSYALMGLLRQRPNVDGTDTAFQAFARLSLANDSDKLLERMICLLPKRQRFVGAHDETERPGTHMVDVNLNAVQKENMERHEFANLTDFWDAQLWDIDPICQICAIAEDDTVVIDGAFAAAVHWDSFQRVAVTTKETWTRLMSRAYLRGIPAWFGLGILLVAVGGNGPTTKGIGAVFLVIAIIGIVLAQFLVLHVYGGKVWNTQPWLFGFEGHMDIDEVEMRIFGFRSGRLSWTPYGSSLSRHHLNTKFLAKECEGYDPFEEMEGGSGKALPQKRLTEDGKLRIFTLVDTNTMTVTLFEAERPPIVALLCGSEGGMQRAVMCSYDWTTQTLYRETVLRMETKVLEKMSRVGRVRFGLQRHEKDLKMNDISPP